MQAHACVQKPHELHKKRGFKWIYFEIPLIVRFLKDFAEMFFVLFY